MNKLVNFTKQVNTLSSTLENYYYIYTSNNINQSDIKKLKELKCAIKTNITEDILTAYNEGVSRDDLYYIVNAQSDDEIRSIFGKCRYVISDFYQLEKINSISKELNKKGFLESIAISFSLDNNSTFCKENLSKLSLALKNADAIAVRGVFFICNETTDNEYINYMKSAYETAKEITSTLPCKITFINFGSCIDSLSKASLKKSNSDLQYIQNTNLVSYLNTTSFYSRFLIS